MSTLNKSDIRKTFFIESFKNYLQKQQKSFHSPLKSKSKSNIYLLKKPENLKTKRFEQKFKVFRDLSSFIDVRDFLNESNIVNYSNSEEIANKLLRQYSTSLENTLKNRRFSIENPAIKETITLLAENEKKCMEKHDKFRDKIEKYKKLSRNTKLFIKENLLKDRRVEEGTISMHLSSRLSEEIGILHPNLSEIDGLEHEFFNDINNKIDNYIGFKGMPEYNKKLPFIFKEKQNLENSKKMSELKKIIKEIVVENVLDNNYLEEYKEQYKKIKNILRRVAKNRLKLKEKDIEQSYKTKNKEINQRTITIIKPKFKKLLPIEKPIFLTESKPLKDSIRRGSTFFIEKNKEYYNNSQTDRKPILNKLDNFIKKVYKSESEEKYDSKRFKEGLGRLENEINKVQPKNEYLGELRELDEIKPYFKNISQIKKALKKVSNMKI